MSVYWLLRWYAHRLKECLVDLFEGIVEEVDEFVTSMGLWFYGFITDLPKDVYKMFVWKAKPNHKYVNPYLFFFLGFVGIIYSSATQNKTLGLIMIFMCIASLVFKDYIKGGWKGYKRKVEAKE